MKKLFKHVEVIKRPRGRPRKDVQPKEQYPKEYHKQNKQQKEKQPRGRPRNYEVGTILKPKGPDYFKTIMRM